MKAKGGFWWALWAAAFLCYEFWAVGKDISFTLSWNIWTLMDGNVLFRAGIWFLLGWLLKHFTWDWYRTRKYR